MECSTTAAQVSIEMLPEDTTHAVQCHWVDAWVEEAMGYKQIIVTLICIFKYYNIYSRRKNWYIVSYLLNQSHTNSKQTFIIKQRIEQNNEEFFLIPRNQKNATLIEYLSHG